MKRMLGFILFAVACYYQLCSASPTGSFFTITESGSTLQSNVRLCLNAYGPLTCQNYSVSHTNLAIQTTVPHHTYNMAGIISKTAGIDVTDGCTPISNGYCIFTVSDTTSTAIRLESTNSGNYLFTAVGYYYNGSVTYPLSYYSMNSGKNWAVSTTLPAAQGADTNNLNAAACDSTGRICTTVGYYIDSTDALPLSYYSTNGGKNWTVSSTLPPQQGGSGHSNYLNGVACDSTGQNCTTVGYYSDGSNYIPLSFYSTNGGKDWTVSTTLPPQQGSSDNQLLAASCGSNGNCTAVGYYNNGVNYAPLSFYSTNGGNDWTVSSTLPPSQGSGNNELNWVACDSTGQTCTAVGFYTSGADSVPLTYYSTNGGQDWTVSSTLPPQQGTGDSNLLGVACDSTGQNCTALGYYNNNVPVSYYSTNGGQDWILSNTLPPRQGTNDNFINNVACNSTGQNCTAVGYYDTGSSLIPLSYYSTNGGRDWIRSKTLPPPQGTGYNYLYGAG